MFLDAVADDEDLSIENYGTYDTDEILKKITSRDAFQVIQDINATAIGDFGQAMRMFNEANGTSFDGVITPTEYVIYDNTKVKSATDNIGIFDKTNPDVRYSMRDNTGKELTKGQQEYFKDSKIRDADGNLIRVFHGTDAKFTVFDRTKGRSTMDIQGMFFSPWDIDAEGYGSNVGEYYLNIKNPAPEGIAYKALNMFKGQNNASVKAREYLESLGYDGVNNGDEEYIAFYPEQIKRTDNINPTKDHDIRYSTRNGEIKDAKELSESDLRDLLDRVEHAELNGDTYIPLRCSTPQLYIDVVREHSGGKINVLNVPMVTTVEHLIQDMEIEDGADYGDGKNPHGLDADDIVSISRGMGNPQYIVLQKNGRYAEIVSFFSEKQKNV